MTNTLSFVLAAIIFSAAAGATFATMLRYKNRMSPRQKNIMAIIFLATLILATLATFYGSMLLAQSSKNMGRKKMLKNRTPDRTAVHYQALNIKWELFVLCFGYKLSIILA